MLLRDTVHQSSFGQPGGHDYPRDVWRTVSRNNTVFLLYHKWLMSLRMLWLKSFHLSFKQLLLSAYSNNNKSNLRNSIFDFLLEISVKVKYQRKWQAILSHRICGMQLLVPTLIPSLAQYSSYSSHPKCLVIGAPVHSLSVTRTCMSCYYVTLLTCYWNFGRWTSQFLPLYALAMPPLIRIQHVNGSLLWPLLLTWVNFNPNMDK